MKKWPLVGVIAGLVLVLDQASKLAAWKWLRPAGDVAVIEGLFDLTFTMNTGVAFGMFAGNPTGLRIGLLAAAAVVSLGVIVFFIVAARPEEKTLLTGLALITGGAIGNQVDRLRLGAVIDFLDLHFGDAHWPAFNIADAAISVGAVLILWHLWRHRHDE